MNERIWERLGAASGLVAAVVLVVGILLPPLPTTVAGADALRIALYFAENRVAIQVAVLLVTLAAVVFLWFVAHLRHVLQRAEGGEEAFSPIVLLTGGSLALATMFSMVPAAALASLTPQPQALSAPIVLALYALHQVSAGAIGLLIALFAITTGVAMVRREVTGPWLGWLGLAVALIGLVGGVAAFFDTGAFTMVVMFVAGLAFAVWVGAASATMFYRPEVDRAAAAGTAFAH